MICDICDANLDRKHYLCFCRECIRPGTVENVLKEKIERINGLNRFITEQSSEIMDLKEENNKYLKIISEQKNKLLQRKK